MAVMSGIPLRRHTVPSSGSCWQSSRRSSR